LHASKSATWVKSPLQAWDAFGYLQILAYAGWLKHNSNRFGDAVTDYLHTNNDAAISKLEDTVRELETRHEMLIAKLSNPTEQMMLAGALAHNAGLRPLRTAITASEAKKIFMAMIAVLKESIA
jgi:hypothetical protein